MHDITVLLDTRNSYTSYSCCYFST